jgi:hypothetical protein
VFEDPTSEPYQTGPVVQVNPNTGVSSLVS